GVTAAIAMTAKMALRSTQMGLGEVGDAPDDNLALREFGLNRPLEEQLSTGHLHRGQESSVRAVGDSFFRAGNTDELLHLIVVRREIRIGQGPVLAKPVSACGFEVIIREAETPACPANRLAANLPAANPHKRLVLGRGVG